MFPFSSTQRPMRRAVRGAGLAAVAASLGLLAAAVPAAPAGAAAGELVAAIVRAEPGQVGAAGDLVRGEGGQPGRDLDVINGFAARVPAHRFEELVATGAIANVTHDVALRPLGEEATSPAPAPDPLEDVAPWPRSAG